MSLIADALKAAQGERSAQQSDDRQQRARSVLGGQSGGDGPAWIPTEGARPSMPLVVAAVGFAATVVFAIAMVAMSGPDEEPLEPRAVLAPPVPAADAEIDRSDPEFDEQWIVVGEEDASAPAGAASVQDRPGGPRADAAPGSQAGALAASRSGSADSPSASAARATRTGAPRTAAEPFAPASQPIGAADRAPQQRETSGVRDALPAGASDLTALLDGSGGASAVDPAASPAEAPAKAGDGSGERSFTLRVQRGSAAGLASFHEAVAAQQRGDLQGAIELYRTVVAQNPQHAEAYNNLGTTYQALANESAARDAFQAAVRIKPAYAAAWSNLGVTLSRLGEPREAQAALAQAVRLDPQNLGARVNLALAYRGMDLAEDAQRALLEVIELDPLHAEANYALAQLLDDRGDHAGAIRHYRAFLNSGSTRYPEYQLLVRQRLQLLTELTRDG